MDFLYHNLEGAARDEVRPRPADDWVDPDSFFRILRDVFSEKLTKTLLLQKFFARKQADREPIMSMAEPITRVHAGALENKDQNLRDTFIENLRDNLVRRDLKRYVREHPEKTFNEVRKEAHRSSEDTDRHRPTASSREVCIESNQVTAMQELAAGQKALADRLVQQQYTRMPLGLQNVLVTFQRLMQVVFREDILRTLMVYLDDIIVFSSTIEEHLQRLETVFSKLKHHGLKIEPAKCQLF